LDDRAIDKIYPRNINKRVFLVHTRPEPIIGVLRRIDTGYENSKFLGYSNKGGTLSTKGLLFLNHCTRFHIIKEISLLLQININDLLVEKFVKMLEHKGDPNDF
jgi:phosphoketolase